MPAYLDAASEQNILNMLMESSVISSDQMSKINSTSAEIKSEPAVFQCQSLGTW